ncbi:helix-turn-helix domain-containing protein [Streptomyces californicus]|uniref:helix-turn-helix domain-containing protein n=2 Tax=Streptomyces californicus TaxID=67351 RepID=UPI003834E493
MLRGLKWSPKHVSGASGETSSKAVVVMLEQPGFGRRLRQLRLQQGKTQAELTGPGMSAAYLSRLESGARFPTQRAVDYLAERLGIPVEIFAERTEDDLVDVVATLASRSDGERDAETRDLLVDALARATDVDPTTRWQALALLAQLHASRGEFPEECEVLDTLDVLSEELARPALQVYTRQRVARCARNRGDVELARRAVREALELGERHRVRVPAADLLRSRLLLVSAETELGNVAEATRIVLDILDALPAERGALTAEAYWTAATVSTRQGDSEEARRYLDKAIDALDSREDITLWMRLRLGAASLCLQSLPPRLERAQALLTAVEPVLDFAGPPRHRQEFLFLQAQLAFQSGDSDRAAAFVAEAEEGLQLLTYRDRIRFRTLQEMLAARAGDLHAVARLNELATEVQRTQMLELAAEVWRAAAECAVETLSPTA